MSTETTLFIYGGLKRGCSLNDHLAGQTFVRKCETESGYRLFDCGRFPGLVVDATGEAIEGELWQVDAECLVRLDILEETPDLYVRREIRVKDIDRRVEGYLYIPSTVGFRDCGRSWE